MAKRVHAVARASSPFLATLILPSRLTDQEVFTALSVELEEERAACFQQMQRIIQRGRAKCSFISYFIFAPIAEIEDWLGRLKASLARTRRDHPDEVLRITCVEACVQQSEVELETAQALRLAREAVSYADPADYWSLKYDDWYRGRGFSRSPGEA